MRNQRNRICLSCLLAGCISLPKVTSGQSDAMQRVPTAIEECEKIGLTTNCVTWQWKGEAFDARWPDGSIGRMTMQQIPGHVVFEREDHSGASPGLNRYLLWGFAFGSNYARHTRAVDGRKSDIGNFDSYVCLSV